MSASSSLSIQDDLMDFFNHIMLQASFTESHRGDSEALVSLSATGETLMLSTRHMNLQISAIVCETVI